MKQYQQNDAAGTVFISPEGASIPAVASNRDYRRMLVEIAAGDAEIVAYVAPTPQTDTDTLNDLMASNARLARIVKALALVVAADTSRTPAQMKAAVIRQMR